MLAQRQPPFKECVTAHWSIIPLGCGSAPKMIGAKSAAEATDFVFSCKRKYGEVGERCPMGEAIPEGVVDVGQVIMPV